MKRKSEAEILLEDHLRECFPTFTSEYKFAPDRRWRFDYAIRSYRVAIEIEGGIWVNGRHSRGKGYQSDLDKYNSATALGWRVYRFSTNDIVSGKDLIFLRAEAERCK